MIIKGLRASIHYAIACPSGHYVEWFARPIKGGWEVDTTGYMSINSWLANYNTWDGWYYLDDIMYTIRDRYDDGKPSLTMMVRMACAVLECKIDRVID